MSNAFEKYSSHMIMALLGLIIVGGIPWTYVLYGRMEKVTELSNAVNKNTEYSIVTKINEASQRESAANIKENIIDIKEDNREIKKDMKEINKKIDMLISLRK